MSSRACHFVPQEVPFAFVFSYPSLWFKRTLILKQRNQQSYKPLEPRQGEPRLPTRTIRDYWGLLGLIRAYWVALAPLALTLMAYMKQRGRI